MAQDKIVLFKTLLPTIKREDLEALCRQHDGFLQLEMDEPKEYRGYHRMAYAYYEPETDVNRVVNALEGYKVRAAAQLVDEAAYVGSRGCAHPAKWVVN